MLKNFYAVVKVHKSIKYATKMRRAAKMKIIVYFDDCTNIVRKCKKQPIIFYFCCTNSNL